MRRLERGASMLGLLGAAAIVLILVGVVYVYNPFDGGGILGTSVPAPKGSQARTSVGRAFEKGHEVECINNLSQIRQAIQIRRTTEDGAPTTIVDLGLPTSMLSCPIGKVKYLLDPVSGSVRCPHLGHERF